MNELLDAMIAEANHLGCCSTELDHKIANSLRRIVQHAREKILEAKDRDLIAKYNKMFPLSPPVPRYEIKPFYRDDLRVQRNVTDT